MKEMLMTSGKRKRAIARATIKKGDGTVIVNGKHLSFVQPALARMRIEEPLILAGPELSKSVTISLKSQGGGVMSQADAIRTAVAKALVKFSNNKELEKTYVTYDRNLLVNDVRRKETRKPNDSKARAKRQKSYR